MTPAERKLQSRTHSLLELWTAFLTTEREVMTQRGPRTTASSGYRGIEAYIGQLDDLHRGSDHFRYAVTTKGESTLEGVDQFEVGHFSEYPERLCTYLEAFHTYYATRIRLKSPYIQLGRDDHELIARIDDVRAKFSELEFYSVTQD